MLRGVLPANSVWGDKSSQVKSSNRYGEVRCGVFYMYDLYLIDFGVIHYKGAIQIHGTFAFTFFLKRA